MTALYNEAVEQSTLDGLEMDQISPTAFASVMLRYGLGVGSSSPIDSKLPHTNTATRLRSKSGIQRQKRHTDVVRRIEQGMMRAVQEEKQRLKTEAQTEAALPEPEPIDEE
eukprot:COSAG01_NODE_9049_length_2570_cov_1.932011_3_plen_111_part_00